MTTFVYRCPNATLKVQGFSVDEVPDGGAGAYYAEPHQVRAGDQPYNVI
jgi:hypothetical protein